MYRGPHTTIWYNAKAVTSNAELKQALLDMEMLIPGVTVWRRGDDGMKALRNRPDFVHVIVWATFPQHAAYLYAKLPPEKFKLLSRYEERRSEKADGFKWLAKVKPESQNRQEVIDGRAALKRLVSAGLVSADQADLIKKRWYQLYAIGVAVNMPKYWVKLLERIDGGGGKTATSIIQMLALGCQRILVICPPNLRDPYVGWPKEIRLFTQLKSFVGWAASDPRRVKQEHLTLELYTESQRAKKQPAIAVYGYDLGDYLSELRAFKPDGIIIDEAHKLRGGKRFRRVINDAGEEVSERVTTEVLGRINRASSIEEVCTDDKVKAVIELTATAFDDGDPETVYNALSLLDDVGTRFAFLSRYKNGPPSDDAKYPQYAERSPSNVDELRARLKAWYLDIPGEITKEFIPCCIVNVIRIPATALGTGHGFGIAARQKALDKEAKEKGWSALERENAGLEFELAVSAVKKLPAVKAAVVEALEENKRVVVYVNRIEVAEFVLEALMKDAPLNTWSRCIHSQSDFNTGRAIEEYSELPIDRPALIVGCVESIGTGINGLAETHLACYMQLTRNPTTVIQAKYRHERPKPRLGSVPTIFNMYIAEGTVDESIESNFIARGSAALALAKTEGLETIMEAVDASSLMSAEQLAESFKDGTFGKDETGGGLGGGEWAGLGDDEDIPF